MRESAPTPTLRGRLADLTTVTTWLAGPVGGDARVCLVEGEAGIGKSRILDNVARDAADRGFAVFTGRADELERARPFGPLMEAFLSEPSGSVDVPPSLLKGLLEETEASSRGDPGARFRIVDRLVHVIESVAIDRPVVLILDDLQWADPSTLVTINSVTRRLHYLDVAVLGSLRPVPHSADLGQLVEALKRRGALHVVLAPLDAEAVTGIVTELIGAEPGASLAAAVEGAAGNPLFVTELVGALVEEGAIEVVAGRAEVRGVPVPPSIRLTILRRLAAHGDDVLELLRHASLLGSTFELRDVAVVMDRPLTHLLQVVEEPVRAGLIEAARGRLRFRHDLIREAIYGDLLDDVRAALHRVAAQRLADAGAPPLQVAEQLLLGAKPGDTRAAALLHDAARSVAGHAPSVAVDLLERSRQLAGPHAEVPHSLLTDLVMTQLWSGRPRDAEATARRAMATAPPSQLAGSLHLGLAQALSAQGRYGDLIDDVTRAVASQDLDADAVAQLKAEAANALLFVGRLDEAEAAAREAVELGRPVASEGAGTGLLVLSDVARGRGAYHEALRHARAAAYGVADRSAVRRGWGPEIFIAMALRALDRFDEADEVIQRGRRIDEELGRVSYLPVYGYELATGLFLAGRWPEAVAEAETALAVADEVGLVMLRSWPLGLLALIALHRGDLEAAKTRIDEAERHTKDSNAAYPTRSPVVALARSRYREACGDIDGALIELKQSWEHGVEAGMAQATRVLGPSLVRLALSRDEGQLAAQVAVASERLATIAMVPSHQGAALLCRGLVDGNGAILIQAIEAYRASPRILERALASEAAASALAATGGMDQAKRMFDRAVDELSEIGADREVGRVLGEMRNLGFGRRRRGGRARRANGWESITAAELEVVRLAAAGLTNPAIAERLFVSPRTVQSHLSHAFAKLGISSRVELAVEADRRGGLLVERASEPQHRPIGSR